MTVYEATIKANVTASIRVVADTPDEATERTTRIFDNDTQHSYELVCVDIAEAE